MRLSNDLNRAMRETAESLKISESSNSSGSSAPRHDLKIIIAKKSSSKGKGNNGNKIKLNKPNGNGSSKVLSDFERLRGDVEGKQFSSSDIVSTSEMKTTLSKKSGTVSHHDLKLENKSNTKRHNSDSHDYYESAMNEREKEKCGAEKQRRESTKHGKNSEKTEKFKKAGLSLNIPKLKIDLPSLKTKITVPKTPSDKYVIASKSPSMSPKGEKRVRFDISTKQSCYDFHDESDINSVDQTEYAERIGLKPVERKVESIILHRKRKKSKHSREAEHSKRPKLHVSSSLDESLKLKLKIMGGKSCKSDKKANEDERTCNLRAVASKTTADLASTNEQREEKLRNAAKEKQKEASADIGLENPKYSVSEQKNAKSGSDQPMVFIPKLVLQKTNASAPKMSPIEAAQRRNSFVVEHANPMSSNAGESIKLKVRSFDAISMSEQKLMKPPHAKMGSPKQSPISTTYLMNPMRPQSIPASLKLSPISQSPPTRNDFQLLNQNLKRSLSLGAEKSSPSYLNAFVKPNKSPIPTSSPDSTSFTRIPPLIPSASSLRNFYGSIANNSNKSQSPQTASKLPNINVKDPMKLFPNACPSVEILKIPQKTFSPTANIKLNRPLAAATIPLEKIRKSAQNPLTQQKILPKQQTFAAKGFHQSSPQCSSQTLNYSGIYQTPINQDISLERYTLELTHDIAKLDRSLSLEKNFEHWERRKLQEYSKLNELRAFPMPTKNLQLNQQQNLSVRNIPNPSAIMMSRNQSNFNAKTANAQTDIEEMLSKSMIAKASERRSSEFHSQKSPVSKVNDKKSIEKLTEYLRLTAAKSRDKHDDDNNNNSNGNKCDESTTNNRNFMSVNRPSVEVICIDS